jgi:hypothetical protein
MRILLLLLTALSLSCTISPVVTPVEESGGDRYGACRRAARDYCRDVVGAGDEDMKRCVSESTFNCLSRGGS